jgi:hypothetical protein
VNIAKAPILLSSSLICTALQRHYTIQNLIFVRPTWS